MEINELINQFLSELKVSPNTLQHYRENLNQLRKFLVSKNICQLDQKTIDSYQAHLNKSKLSIYTKYSYLENANRFLSFLTTNKLLDKPIAMTLPKIKRTRKPEKATFAYAIITADTFLEPCKSRDKLIAALYYLEKFSIAEIANLKLSDLNLQLMEIKLTSRQLFWPLKKKTVPYLLAYLKQRQKLITKSDYLFLTALGKRLTYHGLRGNILVRTRR